MTAVIDERTWTTTQVAALLGIPHTAAHGSSHRIRLAPFAPHQAPGSGSDTSSRFAVFDAVTLDGWMRCPTAEGVVFAAGMLGATVTSIVDLGAVLAPIGGRG